MKLGIDKVKHVAKLANLPLTDIELETYTEQLSKILNYIDQLESVDTTDIEPTFNVTENTNITQEDLSSKSLTQKQVLTNAKETKDGFIVTKGVFNE